MTLYVSSTAAPGAEGTIADPMTLAEALLYPLTPGSTVYLEAGTYTGDFACYRSGKRGNEITWMSRVKGARVTIDGSLRVGGNNNMFDGIEITDTGFTDRTSEQNTPNPNDINGQITFVAPGSGNKFRHCHFKNGIDGYYPSDFVDGGELYGCLIAYNGWYIVGHTYGHGIYARNLGEHYEFLLRHNISFYNFGIGIGPASNGSTQYGAISNLERFRVEENITFENGVPNGIYKGGLIAHCGGSVPVQSIIINRNISYIGARADVNAAANPVNEIAGSGYVAMDGECKDNLFLVEKAATEALEIASFTGNVSGNTILGGIAGFSLETYPDNTVIETLPSGVYVYPDEYDDDRCTVAILNPSGADTVVVDLSGVTGLSVGDTVSVHNAEDYWVDIQSLVLDASKQITVNMEAANRTVEAPVGWATPTTCFPRFGAFVIIKS